MASKTINKSVTSKTPVAMSHKKEVQKYPTSKLLKSKHLAEYQRDFARVILTEPEYTIEEAKQLLDEQIKGRPFKTAFRIMPGALQGGLLGGFEKS